MIYVTEYSEYTEEKKLHHIIEENILQISTVKMVNSRTGISHISCNLPKPYLLVLSINECSLVVLLFL